MRWKQEERGGVHENQSTKSRCHTLLYFDVLGLCHIHSIYSNYAPPIGAKRVWFIQSRVLRCQLPWFAKLGFGSGYVRFYSRYKVRDQQEEIAKLNGMFLVVFSVIGLIAILAGSAMVVNTERVFGTKLSPDEPKTTKI